MTDQNKDQRPVDAFVEHQVRAIEEAGKAIIGLVPADFRKHGKKALKESVKGFRIILKSVADTVSEELRGDEDEGSKASKGPTKVEVEAN